MEHDTKDGTASDMHNGIARDANSDSQVQAVLNNPKFQELVRKKRTLSWSLAALMLFIYIGFILMVAYASDFLHSEFNGATTWGIPLGIGVIITAFVLTAIYAVIANGEHDRLTQDVINELKSGSAGINKGTNNDNSQGVKQP